MRLRRCLAFFVVPAAVALGASCAPVAITADFTGAGTSGTGGLPYNTATGTSTEGSGGATGIFPDGGTGGDWSTPVNPYHLLCGGSQPTCVPDPKTDTCAQGGNPGMGGSPPDASKVSCQIVAPDGGGVVAQCGTSGTGTDGDPCMTAADCGPDLGCIAGLTPTCRPYCCASLDACPTDTYCAKAAMAESSQHEIPVCIPAMKCELLNAKSCPTGLTCAIVRGDGTTSCVPIGSGTDGDACPCAAGFTCSLTQNTCLELCHTGSTECGPNGLCQGGSKPFLGDIGYCVWY